MTDHDADQTPLCPNCESEFINEQDEKYAFKFSCSSCKNLFDHPLWVDTNEEKQVSRFIDGATDEFTIVMSSGERIHTNNISTVDGVREAIKESFFGKGAFGSGINVQYQRHHQRKVEDVLMCINPTHVAYIVDNRKD